jgi:hypothetical protein
MRRDRCRYEVDDPAASARLLSDVAVGSKTDFQGMSASGAKRTFIASKLSELVTEEARVRKTKASVRLRGLGGCGFLPAAR